MIASRGQGGPGFRCCPGGQRWGKLAYWISGFGQLGRKLEEFEAEIDGRVYRCSFALVTKVKNYGGDLQIARRVSILDFRFWIWDLVLWICL